MNEAYVVSRVPRSDATRWTEDSIIPSEPWVVKGSCLEVDPDIFFPILNHPKHAEEAKKICRRCESRPECLEFALRTRQEEGVWGETTGAERAEILRSRRGTP